MLDSIFNSDALASFRWLVCYLLVESSKKLQRELNSGKGSFDARNDSQVYYCRSLAIAFIEVGGFKKFSFFLLTIKSVHVLGI